MCSLFGRMCSLFGEMCSVWGRMCSISGEMCSVGGLMCSRCLLVWWAWSGLSGSYSGEAVERRAGVGTRGIDRRPTAVQSTARAREGRDGRRVGSEGMRRPRCLEDPGGIDGRSWGSGDREGGKVQPPFAQGERVGHHWLRDYTLCEYLGQVGLGATSMLECGMAGWIEVGWPQEAPLREGRRAEAVRGVGSALSGGRH